MESDTRIPTKGDHFLTSDVSHSSVLFHDDDDDDDDDHHHPHHPHHYRSDDLYSGALLLKN